RLSRFYITSNATQLLVMEVGEDFAIKAVDEVDDWLLIGGRTVVKAVEDTDFFVLRVQLGDVIMRSHGLNL
ncbi:Hypothetical predicted protein, partial [Olea europaea subsp. europaea]